MPRVSRRQVRGATIGFGPLALPGSLPRLSVPLLAAPRIAYASRGIAYGRCCVRGCSASCYLVRATIKSKLPAHTRRFLFLRFVLAIFPRCAAIGVVRSGTTMLACAFYGAIPDHVRNIAAPRKQIIRFAFLSAALASRNGRHYVVCGVC